jgi:DNA-binding response OmpR family regulator
MKILLVEDNERVSQFVSKGLVEEGHTVDHDGNGRTGLFLAATGQYDVLVLDRMLPGGVDGLGIVEALRRTKNKTPILILSALVEVDDRIRGLRAGGDDYLTKPIRLRRAAGAARSAGASIAGRRDSNGAHCRGPPHRPVVPPGDARWKIDPIATARIQAP